MAGDITIGYLKRLTNYGNYLAGQIKSAVQITGGTISGVSISNSTFTPPAAVTGTFIASGATGTVVLNAALTANSVISYGLKTVGGTIAGKPYESAVTPGTGFTAKAGASDTSTYNYTITG